MKLADVTLTNVIKTMDNLGYKVFTNDTKNYNLNIVGIRTNDIDIDAFNDILCVFWKYRGNWNFHKFMITTNPGSAYTGKKTLNPNGVAVLLPGQHRGLWKYGTHKGYAALQQVGKARFIRDNNRNGFLDYTGKEYFDVIALNCHRAKETGKTTRVGAWSAACQVFQDASEFKIFLGFCKAALTFHENTFSYTLLLEDQMSKVAAKSVNPFLSKWGLPESF